jgi:hypothetical protein
MTDVTHGHGSEAWLENPANGTLTEIAEVIDIPDLPSAVRAIFETSHLKTVGVKSYKKEPLADSDEIEIQMNYIPGSATDTLCKAALASDNELDFRIVLPVGEDDPVAVDFTVLVMNYTRTNPGADRRVGTLTIKPISVSVEAPVEAP